MKNLYLHIGKHKTGSTSIQRYLEQNRAHFEERGFFIVKGSFVDQKYKHKINDYNCTYLAHVAIRQKLLTPIRIRGLDKKRNYFHKIYEAWEINKKLHSINKDNIIMSAEAFSFIRFYSEMIILKIMFNNFNVFPVVFLREKESWLKSWDMQNQDLREAIDLNNLRDESIFNLSGNSWLVQDNKILEIYGPSIKVLSYEDSVKSYNSVIPVFLDSIGIEHNTCPDYSDVWHNKTTSKI